MAVECYFSDSGTHSSNFISKKVIYVQIGVYIAANVIFLA